MMGEYATIQGLQPITDVKHFLNVGHSESEVVRSSTQTSLAFV